MSFCIALAVRDLRMTLEEAVFAATVGGARALRRKDIGRLAPGCRADVAVLDAPSPAHLAYRPGVPLIAATLVCRGRVEHIDPALIDPAPWRRAIGGQEMTEFEPELRDGPPWAMEEMIEAERELAEPDRRPARRSMRPPSRSGRRCASGEPIVVCGCGTSEHAAQAITAILREAHPGAQGRWRGTRSRRRSTRQITGC